jgi:exodeoxyribonuclease VII large subunit
MKNKGKNVFVSKSFNSSNKNNLLENLSNSSNSSNSSNLSDELNDILGNNSINDISKNKPDNFSILNVYSKINELFFKNYSNCKITCEIISFKISDANAWINIKSDEFQILAIFWKITTDKNYSKLKLTKPGDKFIIEGKFGVMKKNLNIYFNIKSMKPFGKGDYFDVYDGYRAKITEIGLKENKKKINMFPYNIGIITALGGAAIQDILQTFKLDKFIGKIIIKNSLVQGSMCPKSLINSIEWFEENYSEKQIDLLMVTRGGGGWEDLVGFSEWNLLVKLANSKFITLSAVGHQIDNQLTDEVSDYKFATPSIGAKFIVETQSKYKSYLIKYKSHLTNIISSYTELKNKFKHLISNNYSNIIKRYDIKQMTFKVKKYASQINKILSEYNYLKNVFYSKLSNLKPTIIRKKELTSVEDFIDVENDTEIKPKKIEIYFIDGMVKLSYKLKKYEKYD